MAESSDMLVLTVNHRGKKHSFEFQTSATLQTLSASINERISLPTRLQKILITPKPGLLKCPFEPTPLTSLALTDPKFNITVMGSTEESVESLNRQNELFNPNRKPKLIRAGHRLLPRDQGVIHTISSSSASYTFHRLLPLTYLPYPGRAMKFLERLRDDPGIRATMAKHKFSVPLLTEMNPALHTTSDSRTLGLNRGKGQSIELRLRTDAFDGYRDYRTIRRTLCHELAHCVHSNHDREFWDLTGQIEREVETADWKSGGHRLTDQEFYNADDWENAKDGEFVDEGGWTGGEFVLGGSSDSGQGDLRDARARAAEDRMKGKQKEGDSS